MTKRLRLVWSDEGASMGDETSIYLLRRPDGMKMCYRCEEKSLSLSWNPVDGVRQHDSLDFTIHP